MQGVIRSTFVVDEEGIVELAQYNVKATGHVAKLDGPRPRAGRSYTVPGAPVAQRQRHTV